MKKKKDTKFYLGDNMISLKKLPDNSVDSIVSDPQKYIKVCDKTLIYLCTII